MIDDQYILKDGVTKVSASEANNEGDKKYIFNLGYARIYLFAAFQATPSNETTTLIFREHISNFEPELIPSENFDLDLYKKLQLENMGL